MAVLGNSTGELTLACLKHPHNLEEIRRGLFSSPRRISSRFFYDDRGSDLFQKITELEEYYLTRCEFEILNESSEEISRIVLGSALSNEISILEAGPGDGSKAQVVASHFKKNVPDLTYGAIDISPDALTMAVRRLSDSGIQTISIVGDTRTGLADLASAAPGRKIFLFLGSNIGNYNEAGAIELLRTIQDSLSEGDYALIGFDLKKDPNVLIPAYSDVRGVTREFNLNLLDRFNRELGTNFNRNAFDHYAHYNSQEGAMQSFLVSLREQTVHIPELNSEIKFQFMEEIHTENSHKFSIDQIESLALRTGFVPVKHFFDSRKYFTTSLWRVGTKV